MEMTRTVPVPDLPMPAGLKPPRPSGRDGGPDWPVSPPSPRSASEATALLRECAVEAVDVRFCDLFGAWQHFTVAPEMLSEGSFVAGFGVDGSSVRGWKDIHESDMLVVPQAETAFLDPFARRPTLVFVGNVIDPVTRENYSRDPRHVAMRAEEHLRRSGIADAAFFGPEVEFFVFDEVRYEQQANRASYFVDSVEGSWNTNRKESPNLGYKPRAKGGYWAVPPADTLHDLRTEMMLAMRGAGMRVECLTHEVAAGGQLEVGLRFCPLLAMADNIMKAKYVIRNVARRFGKTATFMPKPLFGDNGSGMHVHASLWKGNENLFAGSGYAGLSPTALSAIGGLLAHTPSLLAFCAPTTNSFRRLVPGYEAPINLAYSARNRSAAIRIPMLSRDPRAKRLEYRCPDPTSNVYLALAAILMAMMDGIERRLDPGDPVEEDIYHGLSAEDRRKIPSTPGSLEEALDALEADHAYLQKGGVFSPDLIEAWIAAKRKGEVDAIRLRPHPYEFALYFDA
jgi:glutamine synthetase